MSSPQKVRAWDWRLALTRSDLPGTTRGVAHALACFMDAHGFSYAGIRKVSEAAGFAKQTTQEHLELLEEQDWLEIKRRGNGRSNHYFALVPEPSYLTRTVASTSKQGNRPTSQDRPSYLTGKPSYLTRTDLEDQDISGADSKENGNRSREYARLKAQGLSPVQIAKQIAEAHRGT